MGTNYLKNIGEVLNERTATYLNAINYRDVLQLLTTEYLIAVSTARHEGDEDRLKSLEDPAQFMVDLLKDKIDKRDNGDEAISVEEDLRVASDAKRIAYLQSTDTKWNKRPTSASITYAGASARPATSMGFAASDGGENGPDQRQNKGQRPSTAHGAAQPRTLVQEMRSARELAKKYQADWAKMQEKVKALERKKQELEEKVIENEEG